MTGYIAYVADRSFVYSTASFLYSKLRNQGAFAQVSRLSHLTSQKAYVVCATATISIRNSWHKA